GFAPARTDAIIRREPPKRCVSRLQPASGKALARAGGACGTKKLPEGAGGEPGSDPPDGGGGGKGLFAQRLPDERPCLDPPEVVREPGRDDDPELARPAQDHEQVSVRHGEAAAEKE